MSSKAWIRFSTRVPFGFASTIRAISSASAVSFDISRCAFISCIEHIEHGASISANPRSDASARLRAGSAMESLGFSECAAVSAAADPFVEFVELNAKRAETRAQRLLVVVGGTVAEHNRDNIQGSC